MRLKLRKSILVIGTVLGLAGLAMPAVAQMCRGERVSACCCGEEKSPCEDQFAPSSCCELSREQGERKNALPASSLAPVFQFVLTAIQSYLQDPQFFLSPIHQVETSFFQLGRYLTLKSLLC
jgi:hypothetical protein